MKTTDESIAALEKWRNKNSPFSWWQVRSAQETGCAKNLLVDAFAHAEGKTTIIHGRTAREALSKLCGKLGAGK